MNLNDARRGRQLLPERKLTRRPRTGVVPIYKVKTRQRKTGGYHLTDVDGFVHQSDALPVVLLG